jgi:hypothetical protein
MSDSLDPFAFAGQGEDDAELFELIAEYRRAEMAQNKRDLGLAFEKIHEIRPVTADSDGSRPGFRDDLARHSDLMSLAVPR